MIPAAAKKKKPLCRFYYGGYGTCSKGDSCDFSHAACFPRREEEASPSLVGDKLLSCFDGDESGWRGYKETLLGVMKERVPVEELFKETRTRHLVPELVGSLSVRYPNRYKIVMEYLKEEKRKIEALKEEEKTKEGKLEALKEEEKTKEGKLEALKEEERKLEVAKFKKSPIGDFEIDFRDCVVQAAAVSLEIEKERLKKFYELEARNVSLKSEDFSSFEMQIAKVIRQIRWTKDNVSAKINEIVQIFRDPRCPESISIATFAKQMVSAKQNPFACSYVIVNVTSQFPQAMVILLAEFHRACSYTVPKHIVGSELALDSYACKRLQSTMNLYGALVQTDANAHGIDQGWQWLNYFIDNIPASNLATKTALKAFLETAGFALHKKYKANFEKVVAKTELGDQAYLKEHYARRMQRSVVSSDL